MDIVVVGNDDCVFIGYQIFWFFFGVVEGDVGVSYQVEIVF